jgi:hypothetical protein
MITVAQGEAARSNTSKFESVPSVYAASACRWSPVDRESAAERNTLRRARVMGREERQ